MKTRMEKHASYEIKPGWDDEQIYENQNSLGMKQIMEHETMRSYENIYGSFHARLGL